MARHGMARTLIVWGCGSGAGKRWVTTALCRAAARTVAIVAPPRISNLDEFAPLAAVPGLRLVWARTAAELAGAEIVVLPGSKQVSGDLAWLRAQGLAKRARRGRFTFDDARGGWRALAGVTADGYEIRLGRSVALPDADCTFAPAVLDDLLAGR